MNDFVHGSQAPGGRWIAVLLLVAILIWCGTDFLLSANEEIAKERTVAASPSSDAGNHSGAGADAAVAGPMESTPFLETQSSPGTAAHPAHPLSPFALRGEIQGADAKWLPGLELAFERLCDANQVNVFVSPEFRRDASPSPPAKARGDRWRPKAISSSGRFSIAVGQAGLYRVFVRHPEIANGFQFEARSDRFTSLRLRIIPRSVIQGRDARGIRAVELTEVTVPYAHREDAWFLDRPLFVPARVTIDAGPDVAPYQRTIMSEFTGTLPHLGMTTVKVISAMTKKPIRDVKLKCTWWAMSLELAAELVTSIAETDRSGRARFTQLPNHEGQLTLTHPDYEPLIARTGDLSQLPTESRVLEMHPCHRLSVILHDDKGHAVPEAQVYGFAGEYSIQLLSGQSDSHGRCQLTGTGRRGAVFPDARAEITLMVFEAGCPLPTIRKLSVADLSTGDFILRLREKLPEVRLQAWTSEGKPAAYAAVKFIPEVAGEPAPHLSRWPTQNLSSEGVLSITGLRRLSMYYADISHPKHGTARITLPPSGGFCSATLGKERCIFLRVQCTDLSQPPLPRINIRLEPLNPGKSPELLARLSTSGEVAVPAEPGIAYTLGFGGVLHFSVVNCPKEIRVRRKPYIVTITPKRIRSLQITKDQRPCAQALIYFDGEDRFSFWNQDNPEVEFSDQTTSLTIFNLNSYPQTIPIAAFKSGAVSIDLRPGPELTANLAPGSQASRVELELRSALGFESYGDVDLIRQRAVVGRDGPYRIRLCPGTWRLRITAGEKVTTRVVEMPMTSRIITLP